jgi:hypothetical protein
VVLLRGAAVWQRAWKGVYVFAVNVCMHLSHVLCSLSRCAKGCVSWAGWCWWWCHSWGSTDFHMRVPGCPMTVWMCAWAGDGFSCWCWVCARQISVSQYSVMTSSFAGLFCCALGSLPPGWGPVSVAGYAIMHEDMCVQQNEGPEAGLC